jgi:hypothetical protein
VKGAKRRPVTYAEERRSREPIAQQVIKARFRWLVHRGGRFVEEQPIRLLHESAGEGNALLLTGRKLKRPMAVLVEPSG